MATPTADDIRLRDFSGTFALFSDDQLDLLITDAMCYLGDTPWDGCEDCYNLALICMAMHLGVVGAQGQTPGPMASATAGGISASWSNVGGASIGLNSTRWGQQVEALAAGCGRVGPFVMASDPACC